MNAVTKEDVVHANLQDAQPFRAFQHPAQLDDLSGDPELDVLEVGGSARAGPGFDHDVVDVNVYGPRPLVTLVQRCQ